MTAIAPGLSPTVVLDPLSAITAAVGVILNLAIWFAVHTLLRTLGSVRADWQRAEIGRAMSPDELVIVDSADSGKQHASLLGRFIEAERAHVGLRLDLSGRAAY